MHTVTETQRDEAKAAYAAALAVIESLRAARVLAAYETLPHWPVRVRTAAAARLAVLDAALAGIEASPAVTAIYDARQAADVIR